MSEAQALDQDVIDESKPITFAPREWYFFKKEIERQVAKDEALDFLEAVRVARLYARNESKSKPTE